MKEREIKKIEILFRGERGLEMGASIRFLSNNNKVVINQVTNGSISIHNQEYMNSMMINLSNYIKSFTRIDELVILTGYLPGNMGIYYQPIINIFIPKIKHYEEKISSFIFECFTHDKTKPLTFNNINEINDYYNRVGPFFN